MQQLKQLKELTTERRNRASEHLDSMTALAMVALMNREDALVPRAIKKVLRDAIAAGGSTLRDHAQATGDPGSFQHRFLVYGREGKPCKDGGSNRQSQRVKKTCRGTVKRIVQAGRSTFYCPACQK